MAQKFLDRSDVVAVFQQMRGEGMPERVACGSLGQSSPCDRIPHGLLNQRFVYVVPPLLAGLRVLPAVLLRKDPEAIRLLGPAAVMTGAEGFMEKVQKFWFSGVLVLAAWIWSGGS